MLSSDVSVVIPAFNAERYVGAAIVSALEQTTAPCEVIVVDDGSTDHTRDVAARYGDAVRYVHQQNRGVSAARNRGIELAAGEWIAFLDADDTWLPDKLEKQVGAMRQSPQFRAAYTAHLVVDDELEPLYVNRSLRHAHALADLLLANVVGTPSGVICAREIFDSVGGFDSAFSLCADWEMWLRVATKTDFLYIDEPLVRYRVHDENMSRNVELLERESVATLEKGFAMPAIPPSLRSQRRVSLAYNAMVLAGSYFRARRVRDAARCALYSLAKDPRRMKEILAFAHRLMRGRTGERGVVQTKLNPQ